MNSNIEKNQILKLECIDITSDFFGVCKYNDFIVFVKDMLPLEICDVKLINVKKTFAIAIIINFYKKSKYRIESKCDISNKCGGCNLRHIDYLYQLELKRKIIKDKLIKNNLNIYVEEVFKSNITDRFRNKVQVPFKDKKLGYYRNHSNDIVEFSDCLFHSNTVNKILFDVKNILINLKLDCYIKHIIVRCSKVYEEVLLAIVTTNKNIDLHLFKNNILKLYPIIKTIVVNYNPKETNTILSKDNLIIHGDGYIKDKYLDIDVQISLNSFYQINHYIMEQIYLKALKLANITKEDKVLDLYCGIGTIGLFFAKYCKKVIGVEIVEQAIEDAKHNARINNIKNIDFIKDDCKNIDKLLKDIDVLILDPPRKGIDDKLIKAILKSNIKKIVYISCNYETQIDNILKLKDYYECSNIYPFDMFPNTKHVECVAMMSRVQN